MLNPFEPVQAETIAWSTGIDVKEFDTDDEGAGLAITEIEAGDWVAVSSVDFQEGASGFSVVVASKTDDAEIEIRIDEKTGPIVGTIEVPNTGGPEEWQMLTIPVSDVSGIHDLYFVFTGSADSSMFNFDYWFFNQ